MAAQPNSESGIRESSGLLVALVQACPLAIAALDKAGNVALWNKAAERMFGWSETEVLGGPLPFIPEDKLEEHRMMRAQDLAGHGFTGRELMRKRKDGTPLHISVSTAPIRGEGGSVIGIVSVYEDISERKGAESRFREMERQRNLALQAGQMGTWRWDIDTNIGTWSTMQEALFGLSPGEYDGTEEMFLRLVHEEDRQTVTAAVRNAVQGSGEYRLEYRVIWPDQTLHWLSVRGSAFYDDEGRPAGLTGVTWDATERRLAEHTLTLKADELRRSNADLEQFAYVASHDLQEPLRIITSYADLLGSRYADQLTGEAKDFLGYMRDGVQRMNRMIRDLLAYSRVIASREGPVPTIDTEAAFSWALMNCSVLIEDTLAVITSDQLPTVRAEEMQVLQLFQNLLTNALKYRAEEPPRIHVGAHRAGAEWVFSIRDNGTGIPAQYHDKIFGVFKRLHGRDVAGTGIGLAICRRIVEKHGGRIWVESEPGHGSTFFFSLPAA